MKAVVMAGGEGSRLRPLTGHRPKPLVPVGNQPIMEHILGLLSRHGVTDVVATLHYLAHEIQGYFGDGADFGVNLQYSIEDTPLGTAGSVKQAQTLIGEDRILIISGDALTDCDISAALEFHKAKGGMATIILHRVPNPLEFGVVITGEDGRIERFLEKPGWSEVFSDTVNTGMYILEPEVLDRMEAGKAYDWSQNIFPDMMREGVPIYGYVMTGYWADVGSLSQYREAQEHLLSRQVAIPILGDEIRPGVFAEANCQIDEDAVIVPPVCLGRNCKIKSGARIGPYTAIGDNAFIEERAQIERSVIWDSAYVGPDAKIHSAICGSRVTIKKDVILQEDSVIGDRCLLDVGAVVRPRVKIWPDKIIERGSTVTMSLIWGNKWRGTLFRDLGVAGLSNIELTPEFATRLGAAFGSLMPPKSKIVVSRDSTRSSRMLKRALISAVLGVGCDVVDLHSMALPIVRHYLRTSQCAGGIHVRKLPGNARISLVEFFDSRGAMISRSLERKVETTFSREDFNRTDPDDLGQIDYAQRAIETYQDEVVRLVPTVKDARPIRIVCDYGFSATASFFPDILAHYGVETISLNAANDAKSAPRTNPDIERHSDNLKEIVERLGYDMGVLFLDEGERLVVSDDSGHVLSGNSLLAAMCLLAAKMGTEASVGLSVTAPSRLEEAFVEAGLEVVRTKSDTRSLLNVGFESGVTLAGDDRGGFMWPELHPGFDAIFTCVKLVSYLQQTGSKLSDVVQDIPKFEIAYDTIKCPWERKGGIMRQITESAGGHTRVETLDGVKIFNDDRWVLILPDAIEPMFHLYAESDTPNSSESLVAEYKKRIEELASVSAS